MAKLTTLPYELRLSILEAAGSISPHAVVALALTCKSYYDTYYSRRARLLEQATRSYTGAFYDITKACLNIKKSRSMLAENPPTAADSRVNAERTEKAELEQSIVEILERNVNEESPAFPRVSYFEIEKLHRDCLDKARRYQQQFTSEKEGWIDTFYVYEYLLVEMLSGSAKLGGVSGVPMVVELASSWLSDKWAGLTEAFCPNV